MQSLTNLGRNAITYHQTIKSIARHASLTSAISRGIRRTNRGIDASERQTARLRASEDDGMGSLDGQNSTKRRGQLDNNWTKRGLHETSTHKDRQRNVKQARTSTFAGRRGFEDNGDRTNLPQQPYQWRGSLKSRAPPSRLTDVDDRKDLNHSPRGRKEDEAMSFNTAESKHPVGGERPRFTDFKHSFKRQGRTIVAQETHQTNDYSRAFQTRSKFRDSAEPQRPSYETEQRPRNKNASSNYSDYRGFSPKSEGRLENETILTNIDRPRADERPQHLKGHKGLKALKKARLRGEKAARRTGNPEQLESLHVLKPSSAKAPLFVPYSTAGSEFLYGQFAVKAALQSSRRKLYKLYVYSGEKDDGSRDEECVADASIAKLALAVGVEVKSVSGDWSRILSKMTDSRPHNGFVLETSPLPKLPVTALEELSEPGPTFGVSLGPQSEEDLAVNRVFNIKRGSAFLSAVRGSKKFPLLLMLDRIMDQGNLGAIIRSAYYLGVDGLILLEHGTAPISPITLKASAGASEYLPLLMVKNEHAMVKASQQNGWKFFAATSLDELTASPKGSVLRSPSDMASALEESPCVLILGNEGEGIRAHLQRLADGVAGVERVRGSEIGLDSLNVSVAAALLARDFLRARPWPLDQPATIANPPVGSDEGHLF